MTFSVEVITLVPEFWRALAGSSTGIVGRALAVGAASLTISHLRDFGEGRHRQVDDTPFGGGAGMVLQVGPLHRAIVRARERTPGPTILLTPRGERFHQEAASKLAQGAGLILVAGRYEGVDERVRRYVDRELSLGDFILSAGDPAAWCVIDACLRLHAGVLGNPDSLLEESFASGRLEYPHYTRPAIYDGEEVPSVLRSGNHKAIARWREDQAQTLTIERRPDLLSDGRHEQ